MYLKPPLMILLEDKNMSEYIYGYARFSTREQDLSQQIDFLRSYNCNKILTEKMTDTKSDRLELKRLKNKLRPRDIVVVKSFYRLRKSTKDLIEIVNYFEEHN